MYAVLMNIQWHDIRNPNDPELDRLAERYHLHPLHIEDCRDPNQSAKVEEGPGYLFIVLKLIRIIAEDSLEVADVDIFVGRDFVISVEEAQWPDVLKRRDQMRTSADDIRSDQLLYRIADGIVDSYTPVLDRLDDIIDGLEDNCLA